MAAAAARTRRRARSVAAEAQVISAVAPLIRALKILGGAVVGLAAFAIAWNQLDWWKPASVSYVNDKANGLSKKIDQVDVSTMQNRADTLTAARSRDEGEKSDLQLKLAVANSQKNAPPDYIRMLNDRLQFLTTQATQINNQINAVQSRIVEKNQEATK